MLLSAIRALQAMVTGDQCVDDLPGLLSLAAQLAFEVRHASPTVSYPVPFTNSATIKN